MIDTLIESDANLREIEPHLFSVLAADEEGARYDSIARIYDRMVASPLYLRVAWGSTRAANVAFIRAAFDSRHDGWVVDIAAGSCVDAAAVYAQSSRPTLVVDLSLGMLRKGMERLRGICGGIPGNVFFLQADATALPIGSASAGTVLCHGAYHVFPATNEIVAEWRRVLEAHGSIFVSSLVSGRWLGDRYLNLIHQAGEVTAPRSTSEFAAELEERLGARVEVETVGNFAFARTGSKGSE